jgi:hypothetical protein
MFVVYVVFVFVCPVYRVVIIDSLSAALLARGGSLLFVLGVALSYECVNKCNSAVCMAVMMWLLLLVVVHLRSWK